jgi:hypothetical protein
VKWFRTRRLPVARRPALARDERVVAWAAATGDDVVVVTNLGVWLPKADRLGWHEIHKATWSGRQLILVAARQVAEFSQYAVMEDRPAVSVTLLDPDEVPEQVRARVNRSVAYTSRHSLSDGGAVRVVARRVPGRDGLRWTVRYDPGTPAAADEVAELVAQTRAAVAPGG